MRYAGKVYRPPSEADAYILQATIGCSWNRCTYCDMYGDKVYRERDLSDVLEDLRTAVAIASGRVDKLFIADGDALGMSTDSWLAILDAARAGLPLLRRVSCYATASNLLKKSPEELQTLRERGLTRLYIGPESGDDATLKRIAPKLLIALLAPFREYLESRGVNVSPPGDEPQLDYDTLCRVLLTPDAEAPVELLETLYLVDAMATPEGMDSLLLELRRIGATIECGEDPTPEDVAVHCLLWHRPLLERKHAEQSLYRPKSFDYFRAGGERIPTLITPLEPAGPSLESGLDSSS